MTADDPRPAGEACKATIWPHSSDRWIPCPGVIRNRQCSAYGWQHAAANRPAASGGATDGEREVAFPTNAQLAERAKSLDAHTVVRNWLDRHAGPPPFAWSGRRAEWLEWASANFLADPEIATHLTPAPVASQADGELRAK